MREHFPAMFALRPLVSFGGKDPAVLCASQACKRHVALAVRAMGLLHGSSVELFGF